MKRQELWNQLKKHGITQSSLGMLPEHQLDHNLKIVICHAPVTAKKLIDFICSLDGRPI